MNRYERLNEERKIIEKRKRVAAYCRVSTDNEDQANSFESQQRYFRQYIERNPDWELYEIFADEGISGTSTKKRKEFNRMIACAKNGDFDLIITKEISRFARNTLDSIYYTRDLKKHGVGVIFMNDNINTLDGDAELRLAIMSSIAQEESRKTSERVKWGQKRQMEQGVVFGRSMLGYDVKDGKMTINEEGAKIVRLIFHKFVNEGKGTHVIARELREEGIEPMRVKEWQNTVILRVIRNEKYCGDVLMQKTITVDYLTHKTKKNEGEADQYFIPDHHVGIVSHEDWDRAQELLERIAGKRRKKKKRQQRLIPQKKGRLRGFIAINPQWSTVSHTRLVTATEKVLAIMGIENVEQTTTEREVITMGILEGFEVVNLVAAKGASTLTATASSLKFNKATATELNYPPYIRMLVDAKNRKVAIQPCTEKDPNAVSFSAPEEKQTYAIIVKVPALVAELRRMLQFEKDGRKVTYTISGTCYPEENVIIYDLADAKMSQPRGGRRKQKQEASGGKEETVNVKG